MSFGQRTARQVSMYLLLAWLAVSINAPALNAEGSCLDGIRGVFEKVAEPIRKIQQAAHDRLHKSGRAQAAKVQKILAEEWERAQQGKPKDPEAAWAEHVKKWEEETLDRMTNKDKFGYPTVEELLALMAAKSPTFGSKMLTFLVDKGTIRFKVLAHLTERIHEGKVSGDKMTYGDRLMNNWQKSIKLPARKTWTSDQFALFMTEISQTMFRAMHAEPGFRATWIKAFGSAIFTQKTWRIWKVFAEKFTEDYRAKYKSFMEGVTLESFGEPRPDVMRDFYRFGPWDTIYRRLAAIKVMVSGKDAKKVIEEYGLSQEEADAIHKGPIYDRLPRNLKNAIVIAKNPELYKDVIFNAEVEQLSLELMYFTRPVISGLMLYYTLIEPAYSAYEQEQKRKQFEEDIKKNPDKYIYTPKKAEDDRIKNYDDQINQLTIERRALQKELADNPSLPESEVALRQKAIDKIGRKINNLTELKRDLEKGFTDVHPE